LHPELQYLLQQFVNGLSIGSMYSMIALGYSMVYSLLYSPNFAHGDLYVFGTFIAWSFLMAGLPSLSALIFAGICTSLIGMTIERIVYRPVRNANRIVPMISALGAALILRTIAQVAWGPEALPFKSIMPQGFVDLGGFRIFYRQIIVLATGGGIVIAFTLMMTKTKLGKATQCIMQDASTAALMGIPVNKIIPLIYAMGGFFGVIGGVLFSSYYNVISIDMGIWGTIKAWAAAMLGGVGSFYGAFVGGLLLGLAETFAGAYLHSGFKDAIGYVVIVLILLFKPNGLLGKKRVEKV
jgi:branched-chain amino acid transport system permease protein